METTQLPASDAETERVRELFSRWDLDNSGDISTDELSRLLKTLNPRFTDANCTQLFNTIDANHDGCLQYEEFLTWMFAKDGQDSGVKAGFKLDHAPRDASTVDSERRRRLRGKFSSLDKNGDGKLDFLEVYNFLQRRYPDMSMPDLRFLYDCADKSHDGVLDFFELLDVMVSVPPQKKKGAAKRRPGSVNDDPRGALLYRDDERQMMEQATRKCEQDRKELLALTNELSTTLEQVVDSDQKHKRFREEHARIMREHYARTGELAP